jgi:PleD family two-component response regulator
MGSANIMEMKDFIVVIVGLIILILISIILYYADKVKKLENENKNLLSNIKNIKARYDEVRNEFSREKWNDKIQKETNFDEEYKPSKKLKILIGDYMVSTITNTNSVLRSLGIETYAVSSAEDILELIRNGEKFDVIITNNIYKNSRYDGTLLLNELKEIKNFKTPVIILTVSQDEREHFINECGFDEYMTKVLTQEKAIKGISAVIPKIKFIKKQ